MLNSSGLPSRTIFERGLAADGEPADHRVEDVAVAGLRGLDLLAVDGQDDVAHLDAGLFRRLPLEDLGDADAALAGHAQRVGQVGGQHLRGHARPGFAGQRRAVLVLFPPDLHDRQQLLRVALELNEDGHPLALSFGEFGGDAFQGGHVGRRPALRP